MPAKKDKMEEDFAPKVDLAIAEQTKVAQSGRLNEAVENLLALEKQTRQAEDHLSTSRLAITIVKLCYQAKDWQALNNYLQVLSKRRGQLRTVVQDFVKEAMTYLDDQSAPMDKRMELLDTLRLITEGKIFVEIERARLSRILASIKEKEGKIGEAADILQEIQVETFGQMDKKEKTEFILEQMRLCLDKKDYIKAAILSKKVSSKTLNDAELMDQKLRYYDLLNRLYSHDSKYLDICKSYFAMYETPKIQEDEARWSNYLQLMVVYICLAPHDNEQSDLMHRIAGIKNLEKVPIYKQLINLFMTKELMRWPQFESIFAPELNKHAFFHEKVEGRTPVWEDLKKRVVEHNIRVIEGYYRRITMRRLSQLLSLSEAEAEKFISDLVTSKIIYAKIDRPKGIIDFRKRKDANEFLNEWSINVNGLLDLLEKTCHLVQREHMVHKIE
jgi:26S proteasome regulatory subunit N5